MQVPLNQHQQDQEFEDWGRIAQEEQERNAQAAAAQGEEAEGIAAGEGGRLQQNPDAQTEAFSARPVSPRMHLSEQEREWALAIKTATEADDSLENLTDFQYVQVAFIDHDDVQSALNRLRHLQAFREEYHLRDDIEDATFCLRNFLRQHAGVILSIAYNNDDGNYVMIFDQAAFDQNSLLHPEDWRTHLVCMFYVMSSLSPDFYAMRKGVVFVIECEGYDWKNCDLNTIERTWVEILGVYPVIFRQIKYFHTGMFANMAAALMKRFLPEAIHTKIQLGCRFEGRLDTFYLIPSPEAANERILERMQICLRRRYENEQGFSLL